MINIRQLCTGSSFRSRTGESARSSAAIASGFFGPFRLNGCDLLVDPFLRRALAHLAHSIWELLEFRHRIRLGVGLFLVGERARNK